MKEIVLRHLAPSKIEEVFIDKRPTYQDFINLY